MTLGPPEPPAPPAWLGPSAWPGLPELPGPPELAEDLAELATVVDKLASQDLTGQPDAARAQRLLTWRQQLDRQEGLWLKELAALDALGAAGADQDQPALSTASWLRNRQRMGTGVAAAPCGPPAPCSVVPSRRRPPP